MRDIYTSYMQKCLNSNVFGWVSEEQYRSVFTESLRLNSLYSFTSRATHFMVDHQQREGGSMCNLRQSSLKCFWKRLSVWCAHSRRKVMLSNTLPTFEYPRDVHTNVWMELSRWWPRVVGFRWVRNSHVDTVYNRLTVYIVFVCGFVNFML